MYEYGLNWGTTGYMILVRFVQVVSLLHNVKLDAV
ncbi:hypothetical protein LINPERHAP1_LOCUS18226 [Linum perenne]